MVANTSLTNFKPLAINDCGIIWTEAGLRVGRGQYLICRFAVYSYIISVDALYCKGGGKNSKHGAVTEHYNISALSYINVQVFELAYARTFRTYPKATSLFHTYQFRQLPPFTFLCCLSGTPTKNPSGIELTSEDANLLQELNSAIGCFDAAAKLSRSCKKAKELDAKEDTSVDTTMEF